MNMKEQYPNFPFDQVMATAQERAMAGDIVCQKWTCAGCGRRLTGAPRRWTEMGRCEDCGHVTNLRQTGCNYLLIQASGPGGAEALDGLADAITREYKE